MAKTEFKSWRFDRQINVSVLVQLVFLASLIVGSWVNLQRQLDLLQRDVTYLCQFQKTFEAKLESLSAKSISFEYRLRAIEKTFPELTLQRDALAPMAQQKREREPRGETIGF